MSGLSQPRTIFGVHSFTPYSRVDGTFYGTLKVLKSSSLVLAGQLIELYGGSSKYGWAVEDGPINAEMSLKFSQYSDFLFTLFLGAPPTVNATEALGSVTVLTNKLNASVKNATTGVASIAIHTGSEADLKFGNYVVVAASATTVNVYYSSDADIGRGTDGLYQDDSLKVNASPLTITTGGVLTLIPNFGLDLVGGSGAIAMVTGDTAVFTVRPQNLGSMAVTIGSSSNSVFPEFGCVVMAQKRGNQELTEVECFRCKGAGMPINFDMHAWSEADIKIKVFYDSVQDGVFKFTHVKPSGI